MSNEEKILKILETLVSDVAGLKNDVAEIKAVQKVHGEKLDRLENDLQFVKNDVTTIKRVVLIQSGRLDDLDRAVKIG